MQGGSEEKRKKTRRLLSRTTSEYQYEVKNPIHQPSSSSSKPSSTAIPIGRQQQEVDSVVGVTDECYGVDVSSLRTRFPPVKLRKVERVPPTELHSSLCIAALFLCLMTSITDVFLEIGLYDPPPMLDGMRLAWKTCMGVNCAVVLCILTQRRYRTNREQRQSVAVDGAVRVELAQAQRVTQALGNDKSYQAPNTVYGSDFRASRDKLSEGSQLMLRAKNSFQKRASTMYDSDVIPTISSEPPDREQSFSSLPDFDTETKENKNKKKNKKTKKTEEEAAKRSEVAANEAQERKLKKKKKEEEEQEEKNNGREKMLQKTKSSAVYQDVRAKLKAIIDSHHNEEENRGKDDNKEVERTGQDRVDEFRIDPNDGHAYTKNDFVNHYGSFKQWNAAKPAPAATHGEGRRDGAVEVRLLEKRLSAEKKVKGEVGLSAGGGRNARLSKSLVDVLKDRRRTLEKNKAKAATQEYNMVASRTVAGPEVASPATAVSDAEAQKEVRKKAIASMEENSKEISDAIKFDPTSSTRGTDGTAAQSSSLGAHGLVAEALDEPKSAPRRAYSPVFGLAKAAAEKGVAKGGVSKAAAAFSAPKSGFGSKNLGNPKSAPRQAYSPVFGPAKAAAEKGVANGGVSKAAAAFSAPTSGFGSKKKTLGIRRDGSTYQKMPPPDRV